MDMAEDYYKTLGVRRGASQAEIQRAYRELARKYHPDMNPDDKTAKQKFQEIQKAFDVLNDPEKRELYDRYGSSFETAGAGGPQQGPFWRTGPGGGVETGPAGFGFEDIDFTQFFGERFREQPSGGFGDIFRHFRRSSGAGAAAGRSSARRRGADITHDVQIPFNVSITGGEVQITVGRQTGKTETISVKIPPGVEDGKKIRVRGQGGPGARGGQPGDILITVRVAPHPYFQRRGNHLHVKVPVTLAEAALGASVDVPTPSGTVSLKVPPGTSGGTKLRVKGHGVTPRGGPPGDLFAEIQIVLPKDLGETDRQAIREFDRRHPQNPRTQLRW